MVDKQTFSFARELRRRKEQDPHGFHDMTERELIDWLGGGNAKPGSDAYEHGKLVLESKRNQRLLVQGLDSEPEERSESKQPETPKLTGIHLAILALAIAAFGAAFAASQSVVGGMVAAVIALALLFIQPIRDPVLRWLDRLIN